MNRRFVALVIVLAIGLQGPSLAYASAVGAKTMPPACASHAPAQNGHDHCPCCPEGSAPGLCCSGATVLAAVAPALGIPLMIPVYRVPAASDPAVFATERPTPLLRPPIA